MDSNKKLIVNRIKNRRKSLGYTYQTLAEKTNISKSTLQRYESGTIKNIPLDKLEVLANALEINPAYLIGIDYDVYNNVSTVKEEISTYNAFTKDEVELIEKYRNLSKEGKAVIKYVLENEKKNG